jgi:MFS family permease
MNNLDKKSTISHLFGVPVIVAALGYFVDIYDLLLFGIVRVPSLKDLGLSEQEVSQVGASILNWQMIGLLIGGILWGVLGDKKGRLSVLFGSILTYSLANIACGYVQDPAIYKFIRFVAGVGLAGELGAGITLVSESLPKQLRAIGTSLVAGIGLLGAVFAYFTVEIFEWRTAYFIGGGMGISLLVLRIGVFESSAFEIIKKQKGVNKGDFLSFFTNYNRFIRYIKCIGIGLPTWFVIGILTTFSNEFGSALGITHIKPGLAIMWCYIGLSIGDLLSGILSHLLQSRKRAVGIMMGFALLFATIFLFIGLKTSIQLYMGCLFMGIGIGYWAMFVTIGAEQFGTNLRATAATTIPNMVRGTVVVMTFFYGNLKPEIGVIFSGAVVGIICFLLGIIAIYSIEETHNRNLNFLENE